MADPGRPLTWWTVAQGVLVGLWLFAITGGLVVGIAFALLFRPSRSDTRIEVPQFREETTTTILEIRPSP